VINMKRILILAALLGALALPGDLLFGSHHGAKADYDYRPVRIVACSDRPGAPC
jgi:hypothetical protein